MGDDNSVLAQSEIDALFKPVIGKSAASAPARPAAPGPKPSPGVKPSPGGNSSPNRAPAAPASAQPRVAESRGTGSVVAETVTPSPSNEAIKALQASLADLAQRITKVEISIRQLSHREQQLPEVDPAVQQLSKKLPAVVKELQKVNDQVRDIGWGLEATPDYGVRRDFTCSSCGSHGFVAMPMKCTKCGSEGWWGWWPKA